MTKAKLDRVNDDQYVLSGDLSFESVPALWRSTDQLFEGLTKIQIDLSAVDRADSAGLALLVDWMRTAQQREVSLQFIDIPAQMLAIARVSGLDDILPLKRSTS